MSSTSASLILGIPSLVAAWVLYRTLRSSSISSSWNASSTVLLAVGVLYVLPTALVGFQNSVQTTIDPQTFAAVKILPASEISNLQQVSRLIAFIGVAIVFLGLSRIKRHQLNLAPALALVLAVVGIFIAHAESGVTLLLTSHLSILGLLLGAVFLPRGRGAAVGLGVFGVLLGLGTALEVAVQYKGATVPCTYKCGPLGVLVTGLMGNGNELVLLISLTVPFVWLGLGGRAGVFLSAYLVFITYMTGSRTGFWAALAAFVLLAIVRPGYGRTVGTGRTRLGVLAALSAAVAGVVTPIVTHSSTGSFTGRPVLWGLAWQSISHHPVIGLGPGAWGNLAVDGLIPTTATYSPHNQLLDVLYATGALGLLLFLGVMALIILPATPQRLSLLSCMLIPALVDGIAERPWSVGAFDWMTVCYIGLLIAAPEGQIRRDRHRPLTSTHANGGGDLVVVAGGKGVSTLDSNVAVANGH